MRKNVYVDDELGKRADKYSDGLNFSKIFRNALKTEVLRLEAKKASCSERLKEDEQERAYFWNRNGKGFGDVWLDQYLENFVVEDRVSHIKNLARTDRSWIERLPEWAKFELEMLNKITDGEVDESAWAKGFIYGVRERNEEKWNEYLKEMI